MYNLLAENRLSERVTFICPRDNCYKQKNIIKNKHKNNSPQVPGGHNSTAGISYNSESALTTRRLPATTRHALSYLCTSGTKLITI